MISQEYTSLSAIPVFVCACLQSQYFGVLIKYTNNLIPFSTSLSIWRFCRAYQYFDGLLGVMSIIPIILGLCPPHEFLGVFVDNTNIMVSLSISIWCLGSSIDFRSGPNVTIGTLRPLTALHCNLTV